MSIHIYHEISVGETRKTSSSTFVGPFITTSFPIKKTFSPRFATNENIMLRKVGPRFLFNRVVARCFWFVSKTSSQQKVEKIRLRCWSAVSPPFCCFWCGETTTKTSFFMHNWLSLLFWELGVVQGISHLSPLFCSLVIWNVWTHFRSFRISWQPRWHQTQQQ